MAEKKDVRFRAPICTVVGHVDHGKSSILDFIRDTNIIDGEAGGITQAIGSSMITLDKISKLSNGLINNISGKLKIPGLLFIDTPGHEAFTTLRRRGGNLADLAILVVDINEGFKPQTIEALEILKGYKTPFIVAANKIDLIPGWKSNPDLRFYDLLKSQSESVAYKLDELIYNLVGVFYEMGMRAERFDRVKDYTKEISIVPVSAKSGEGISELMMLLIGLAQKFLNLRFDDTGFGKGTVLELKKINGIGYVIDIILYDGTIKLNDTLVIGGVDKPIVTKVKSILNPKMNSDMRDKKTKFDYENEAVAASGVRIIAPDLDDVVAGMPLVSVRNELATKTEVEKIKGQVSSEIEDVFIDSDKEGIIVKADSIGSLEALIMILRSRNVKIRKAHVGNIMKKDIFEANSNKAHDPLQGVILAFNVDLSKDAHDELLHYDVKIINHDIIYKVIDEFFEWLSKEKERIEREKKSQVRFPAKIRLMPNYIFRQSNPAIAGVDVMLGKLVPKMRLMNSDGVSVTTVDSIQENKDKILVAEAGKQVAVSFVNVTIGRQIKPDEVLYSVLSEKDFRALKDNKDLLELGDLEILKEISVIMRKTNPTWGI